jgi:plasmid stabilization system protein ParE
VLIADRGLVAVATALGARLPELSAKLAEIIRGEIDFYRVGSLVSPDELRETCQANLEFVFRSLAGDGRFDTTQAYATGVRRATAGAPLPAVMDAYRVGSRFIWNAVIDEAVHSEMLSSDELIRGTSDIWLVQDTFTQAMTAGYREEMTNQILVHERERSALVEALLDGRITDSTTLWEIAENLRIDPTGWHVVVAAEAPDIGSEALPNIERNLRARGIASAWRLLPGVQVGIASLSDPDQMGRLVTVLERYARCRVGISPRYESLEQTARAVRLARIAMKSARPKRVSVVVFEANPLAVAAVGNADVMQRVARTVLGGLDTLTEDDKAILLNTLEAWLDCGGSANATAERIYCHPNTVRHRLRRIEERTGRSLSDPRQLTELCLALETERRLPPD